MAVPESALIIGTLIPLLSIFMGGLIVLVPVVGLAARFALKPAMEALGAVHALPSALAGPAAAARQVEELSRRVQQLEEQLNRARLQAGETDDARSRILSLNAPARHVVLEAVVVEPAPGHYAGE